MLWLTWLFIVSPEKGGAVARPLRVARKLMGQWRRCRVRCAQTLARISTPACLLSGGVWRASNWFHGIRRSSRCSTYATACYVATNVHLAVQDIAPDRCGRQPENILAGAIGQRQFDASNAVCSVTHVSIQCLRLLFSTLMILAGGGFGSSRYACHFIVNEIAWRVPGLNDSKCLCRNSYKSSC